MPHALCLPLAGSHHLLHPLIQIDEDTATDHFPPSDTKHYHLGTKFRRSPQTRSPQSRSPQSRSPQSKSPQSRSPQTRSPQSRSPQSRSPVPPSSPRSGSPVRRPRSQSPSPLSRSRSPSPISKSTSAAPSDEHPSGQATEHATASAVPSDEHSSGQGKESGTISVEEDPSFQGSEEVKDPREKEQLEELKRNYAKFYPVHGATTSGAEEGEGGEMADGENGKVASKEVGGQEEVKGEKKDSDSTDKEELMKHQGFVNYTQGDFFERSVYVHVAVVKQNGLCGREGGRGSREKERREGGV